MSSSNMVSFPEPLVGFSDEAQNMKELSQYLFFFFFWVVGGSLDFAILRPFEQQSDHHLATNKVEKMERELPLSKIA